MNTRIKEIREYVHLTQAEFAKKIGRTKTFISGVECGVYGMSSKTICSICSTFGVNEEWLKNGTGDMFVEPTPPYNPDEIRKRIKQIRLDSGLSQQKLADRVGCH